MKKLISVLLATVMLFAAMVPAFAAFDNSKDNPVIYIKGQGRDLVDGDGNTVYRDGYGDLLDSVKAAVPDILKTLSKALITNDYSDYCDAVYNAVATPFYSYRPDKNGESENGVDVRPTEYQEKYSDYEILDYSFVYDWRLSPYETADRLHDFIGEMKKLTKHDTFNIVVRCYGANVLGAYLERYGVEDIDHIVLYSSAALGTLTCGALMSGNVDFNAQTVNNFTTSYFDGDDDPLIQFITAFVTVLRYTGTLNLTTSVLNNIYENVRTQLVPRLLRDTIGRFPGYWAMVGDEYYEDAKKFIFEGYEDEYAELIEKNDDYHYNIMNKFSEILTDCKNQGLRITVISKYNVAHIPIFDSAYKLSDDTVETEKQSFGATCADFGKTLSAEYLEKADKKYVSADKKIDASTCLFPENTWFVKNTPHLTWPDCVHDFIMLLLKNSTELTVDETEGYGRFTDYDSENEKLVPVTKEDNDEEKYSPSFIKAFIEFIKSLFALIKAKLFNK